MMRKLLILTVIPVLAAVGCSREGGDAMATDEPVEFKISMGTKAGSPADDTYRVVLFQYNAINTEYASALYNGSYRNKDAKAWMTPCQVNPATGEWMADNPEYGLRAEWNSTYRMSIVTPARQTDWRVLNAHSTTTRYGYHLTRTGDGLLISSPVSVNVGGNHLNRQYIYQADQQQMKDRRARLTIKLECGQDLLSVHVNKLVIKNIYSAMSYDFGSDSLLNPTLDVTGVVIHDTGDPEIELLNGEAATQVCSDFYLFALNYDRIDSEYHFIYDVPQLEVTMGSGVVSVPLHYNLKPQYSYTYTLSINSAFVKLAITAQPWNDTSGSQDVVIDEPVTDMFTFNPGDWDTVDAGKGTI